MSRRKKYLNKLWEEIDRLPDRPIPYHKETEEEERFDRIMFLFAVLAETVVIVLCVAQLFH